MNKIICNTEEMLKGHYETLILKESNSKIHITEDTTVDNLVFEVDNFDVHFIFEDNVKFSLKSILDVKNISGKIHLEVNHKNEIYFGLGIKSFSQNKLDVLTDMIGNDSNCEVKIRIVGETNSKMVMKTSGNLPKDTQNNIFGEDVKYLFEEDSYIEVLPELYVFSNDVLANHNMSVGKISEEELFYLESKGLNKKRAQDIYREGFINSIKK